MIEIKSEKKSYGINFPTSIKELTPEILATISEGVKLPKHYCIVALAFDTKVFDFCTAMNSNKNTNVAVTPIMCKISKADSEEINANVGDKLIIDRSSLERGVHLNLKCSISSTAARNYFNSDSELVKAIVTKKIDNSNIDEQLVAAKSANIIILEFKIIPVNDISAAVPMFFNGIDPFVVQHKNIN